MSSAAPAAACRRLRSSFCFSVETSYGSRAPRHNCGATSARRLGWLLVVALTIAPAVAAFDDTGSAPFTASTSAGDGGMPTAEPPAGATTFEVPRYVIAGGGRHSAGGNFDVEGTIGQAGADPQPSTGGAYAITGGFWFNSLLLPGGPIFADGFEDL